MNSFILLMTFVVQFQWFNCNANETSKLGISSCMYSGLYDKNGKFCPDIPMDIKLLPTECTSFLYQGLYFDNDFSITMDDTDEINIINLSLTGKPVYLYIDYIDNAAWINLAKNAKDAADKLFDLKKRLDNTNITGLTLRNMNSDPPNDVQFDKTFFDNLKQFVTELKTKPVTPEVGLYVNATSMMYYSNNPNVPGWFNFADWMNDLMDYYIIGFDKFNPCNDQFKSGIVPLNDSNVQTNNTLTAFANVLKSSNIAKDKIYLEFSVSPITDPEISDNIPRCYVSYKKYCDPDNTQMYGLSWCADNADAFFQKGKFASDLKAMGIVAKYIDLSDPTGNCGCDNQNQFITFSMILRGFLNQAPITDCEKLKNTAI